MLFSWDFNTATLLAIGTQIVLTVVYVVKAANSAKTALDLAEEAKKLAVEALDKNAILHGLLGLHREQVAKEYVDKETLREMEDRIAGSINRLSDRIDEALNRGRGR